MTDKKAMSRALGAAFLNHQVEQLEKSAASGNWRSRAPNPQPPPRRQQPGNNATITTTTKPAPRKKTGGVLIMPKDANTPSANVRRSIEEEKDADVVVVDASVLVHALHQVKKWCRDGRTEVIIVPLEALNTLDLLKKGTSPIAQRARAASRILEAQVGTNLRIRVQQDDAFVPWDTISFSASPTAPTGTGTSPPTAAALSDNPDTSPEWVRRTVCCARWELDATRPTEKPKEPRTVRLAVLDSDAPPPNTADGGPASKHELRAAGTLVAHWAARAGLSVLPIGPSIPGVNNSNSNNGNNGVAIDASPRRPRSGTQTKRGGHGGGGNGHGNGNKGGSLVERPAAALAMEVSGPRVVRVLARGERLDVGA